MAEHPAEPSAVDVDRILVEIRETVAERHRSGEYPPELEAELARHFERIVAEPGHDKGRIDDLLHDLDLAADFGRHRIYADSAFPLGDRVHRLIARTVARQTDGVLRQMREYHATVRAILVEILDAIPDDDAVSLGVRVDDLLDRVGGWSRAGAEAEAATRELSDRVARLEARLRRDGGDASAGP